jgi:hypothetical protein
MDAGDATRQRKRNIRLAVALAVVSLGFYVAFFLVRGLGGH